MACSSRRRMQHAPASRFLFMTQLFITPLVCLIMSLPAAIAAKHRCSSLSEDTGAAAPPPYRRCRLQYYVQVEVGDASLNKNLLPDLNSTYSGHFGHGEIFAFNVTREMARDSTPLGFVRGYTFQSSYHPDDPDNLIEVEFVSYNDGLHMGTIQIQGQIIDSANEVAITGGTGSFRGARGYGLITRQSNEGNYVLYHHDLRFLP